MRGLMIWVRLMVLAVAAACWGATVLAEERLALVIGNSAYGSVSPLDNPVRDARLIAQTLEGLGFDVTLAADTRQIEMKRAIGQFGRKLRGAGDDATGLFYYAGHGVQSFGSNYLLPVDVALADAADLDLMAVEAQSVLRQMASARNRTNIVILDACRNNPFEAVADLNESGLAEMKAPTGTFLAYATAPGDVALDGPGKTARSPRRWRARSWCRAHRWSKCSNRCAGQCWSKAAAVRRLGTRPRWSVILSLPKPRRKR
ncbi:caspase domain-containing protein [Leisingera sp. NJS201]|uniref:caspase domain-containing protein n=1 Tax=Leisingera sp. NJS201 TaxID=2508306 RepID=UPI00268794CE